MNYMTEGDKVGLGPIKKEHSELWAEWFNKLEVTQYLSTFQSIMTPEKEEEFYERVTDSDTDRVFSIYELDSDRPIGVCGLHQVDYSNRSGTLGIVIGEKDCWDRGYGSETITLLLDYGFVVLSLHSINLTVREKNGRAKRTYEKVGFVSSGRLRDHWLRSGDFYDIEMMDILRDEFYEKHDSVIGRKYLQT